MGLPVAAELGNLLDECVEIDFAGRGDENVAGTVARLEVRAHRVDRQIGDAAAGAEHAAGDGVAGKVQLLDAVVHAEGRLVEVHLDLFQDDFLLGVEIVRPQAGAEDVGQEFDAGPLVLRQHGRVIGGALLAGEGIVVGADFVESTVDVVGRARGRAFEAHVLEKVADAGDVVRFVARAGADEKCHAGGVGVVVGFGNNFQAVRQRVFTKFQRAPPAVLARASRQANPAADSCRERR
jgi:hypothetical protein